MFSETKISQQNAKTNANLVTSIVPRLALIQAVSMVVEELWPIVSLVSKSIL